MGASKHPHVVHKLLLLFLSQVITGALQSLLWVLKFPLPAVDKNIEPLTKQLFLLLKDFAKPGAAKGQNFHLVVNCFKVSLNETNGLICSLYVCVREWGCVLKYVW